jgi:hypothetical protein
MLVCAWSPVPRVIWWLLRPLATLTAVVGCLLLRPGTSLLVAIAAAAGVAVVRPVRRSWVGLVLVVALVPISVVAAAAVAVRTLLTTLALVLNGPGRAAGIDRLVAARRRILGPLDGSPPLDLPGAWNKVREYVEGPPELELSDALSELLAAAWCEADTPKLAATAWAVVVGIASGRWPFGRKPTAEGLIFQMIVRESVVDGSVELAAATASGVVAFAISPQGAVHLLSVDLTRWIAVLAGAMVGMQWSRLRLGMERPGIRVRRGRLGLSSLALLLLGLPGVLILLIATAVGLALAYLNRGASRLHLTSQVTAPRLPMSLSRRRGHAVWRAARSARTAHQLQAAERLWTQLADDQGCHVQVRALSHAMLAELALDSAQWDEAVRLAAIAVDAVPPGSFAGYHTRVVAARVRLTTAEPVEALALLEETEGAGFRRRLRQDPVARMVYARALAANDRADDALGVLSEIRGRVRAAGFGPLIESETVVAAALGKTDPVRAADRLAGALKLVEDPVTTADADPADRERLAVAAARGRLTLGFLELRLGRTSKAEQSLITAARTLPAPAELANRATAQVLLGCALGARGVARNAVGLIGEGLEALESTRGQLRASHQRSRLVVELDEIYRRALDALIRLQSDDAAAGDVAAVLLESLRRDALAGLLHAGRLELDAGTQAIVRRINELETGAPSGETDEPELARLRTALAASISELYAAAYSPSPVSLGDLRRRSASAHVLTFRVTDADETALRGYAAWVPPMRSPSLAPIELTDSDQLAAVGLHGRSARHELMRRAQYPGDEEYRRWQELGEALIPAPLDAALAHGTEARPERLVVVPDSVLSAFPWAALRLRDGRRLVEAAVIQVVPAMSLIAPPKPGAPAGAADSQPPEGTILLHRDDEASDEALSLLATVASVKEASSQQELKGSWELA